MHGARGRRRGRAKRSLGAGLTRDVPDLEVRLGGAEGALAAADARGRGHRLLRADRARRRLRPRLDADSCPPGRLRLGPERGEDVDHQRDDRRRRRGLGPYRRRRDPRLPRREGHARVLGAGDPQEALAASLRHVRARAAGRARAGRERPPRGDDAPRPALVPERGALRDRLGRRRLRPRLLRVRARVRERADRLRQAGRGLPADAGEARGDGARAQPRVARRAASRPQEGRGHAPARAREPREARERPRRARGREERAHDPRARTA